MLFKLQLRGVLPAVGILILTAGVSIVVASQIAQETFDTSGRKIDSRPLPEKEPGRFIMSYIRTMQERFRQRTQRYGELPEVWHDPLRNWTPVWLSDASFVELTPDGPVAPGSKVYRLVPGWDVVFERSEDGRHFKILVVNVSTSEMTRYALYNIDNATVYVGTCVGWDLSTFKGAPIWAR